MLEVILLIPTLVLSYDVRERPTTGVNWESIFSCGYWRYQSQESAGPKASVVADHQTLPSFTVSQK